MSDFYIGEIRMFPYSKPIPHGWLPCNGQTLNIQQYTALFSLLTTQYGGDGKTTFNLPDLQGRTPLGITTNGATNPTGMPIYSIGVKGAGGAETVALNNTQVPPHTHNLAVHSTNAGVVNDPTGNLFAASGTDKFTAKPHNLYAVVPVPPVTQPLNSASLSISGSGAAHNNMQPSAMVQYCIAYLGLYPTRP
jgi:microcystin-dependent protein